MKTKKMFLLFGAFIFAAVAIYNIHLAQTQNIGDISLADIEVMAQADGEATIECHQYWEYGRCNQCYIEILCPDEEGYPCKWFGYTNNFCCI